MTDARLRRELRALQRVQDYRKNALDCRDLAAKMPKPARAQLLEFAKHWDELAEERERYLANRGLTDEPTLLWVLLRGPRRLHDLANTVFEQRFVFVRF